MCVWGGGGGGVATDFDNFRSLLYWKIYIEKKTTLWSTHAGRHCQWVGLSFKFTNSFDSFQGLKKNAFTLLLPLINPVPVVHFHNHFVSSFLRSLLFPCYFLLMCTCLYLSLFQFPSICPALVLFAATVIAQTTI